MLHTSHVHIIGFRKDLGQERSSLFLFGIFVLYLFVSNSGHLRLWEAFPHLLFLNAGDTASECCSILHPSPGCSRAVWLHTSVTRVGTIYCKWYGFVQGVC